MPFVADFETTTDISDCRVWAWGVAHTDFENFFQCGNTLHSFIEWCSTKDGEKIYFHNLKFDAEFLLYHFLKSGYKTTDRKRLDKGELQCLISDMGQFYSMRVCLKCGAVVTFWDSLKLIPLKVSEIPKAFGLSQLKGDIDYKKYRPSGYMPDSIELEYLRHDVQIVAKALKIMLDAGLNKMTQAGCALKQFKTFYDKKSFERLFPAIKNDSYIRKSYKGGYVYLNPDYKSVDLRQVNIYDVNSLYPSVMYHKPMPVGHGVYFKGQYRPDKFYHLYIQRIRCAFEIKPSKLPTIQIKNNLRYAPTEYLESSGKEVVELTLTSVDLLIFFENYEVFELEYVDGYMYRAKSGVFTQYIDYWISEKEKATIEKNAGKRQIAKLMLNSLYGRFALKPRVQGKIPYLDSDMDIVKYRLGPEEEREPLYLPIGAFITAYAREQTIRTAQAIRDYSLKKYGVDKYIYSDTDSIHTTLSNEECEKLFEVHSVKLGAWKYEGTAQKARFLRAKTYIEYIEGRRVDGFCCVSKKITCAGLPPSCYTFINWHNFFEGLEVCGKLTPKRASGGVVLVDTTFSIK